VLGRVSVVVRVMISYARPDRGRAIALKEFLIAHCRATQPNEVRVVEREVGSAEELPKRVANEIEACQVFITMYTKAGAAAQSPWLNQELGYAFRLLREGRLIILPLWEGSRTDLDQGFLSASSIHIDDRFKLAGEDGETFENVKDYLEHEYRSPLEFRWQASLGGGGPLLTLYIDTRTSAPVLDASLSFVVPRGWRVIPAKLALSPPVAIADLVHHQGLSSAIQELFHIEGEFDRYTLPFQKLAGLETHYLEFYLDAPPEKSSEGSVTYEVEYGIYIVVPIIGTRTFQGQGTCVWIEGGGYRDFQGSVGELAPSEKAKVAVRRL